MRRCAYSDAWCAVVGVRVHGPAELGRLVGLDATHAWRIVTGRYFPSGRTVLKMARALGRPADAVLLACAQAEERRARELEAERVRRDAERRA